MRNKEKWLMKLRAGSLGKYVKSEMKEERSQLTPWKRKVSLRIL